MKFDYSRITIVVAMLVMKSKGQFDEDPNPDDGVDPFTTGIVPIDTRMPQTLPPTFQVHIEATFIDKKESLTADEYVDTPSGYTSMVIKRHEQTKTLIANYNTDEMYHIQNNTCTVNKLDTNSSNVFIGGSRMSLAFSTGSVLTLAQEYGEMYMGQSTVRGIATDHWQTSMYWSALDANFTLDLYFTQPNWTTADDLSQIPVRAEVQGYTNIKRPGPVSSFHHIYDYVGFIGHVQDPTVFETTRGIPCPGRVNTSEIPHLKPQFQYKQEVTSVMDKTVTSTNIWYDFNRGLLRFDHTPSAVDAVTEIHDYNTGVAYIIDKGMGNCSIVPINPNSWDASINTTQGTLDLKTPEQLFYLDSSFVYSGQRKVRGITCNVFSTIKSNYTAPGLMGMNVSFDIYFMTNSWSLDDSTGHNMTSADIPVRLEIWEPVTGYDVIYDFFDFDQEHSFIDTAFNIAPCFPKQQHIDFYITFPGDRSDMIQHNRRVFQRTVVEKLVSVMNVSSLRIQSIELHLDKNNMFFVGKLLDRNPTLAKFHQSPTKVAQYTNNQLITGVSDVVSCAGSCDEQTQDTCNSFDYCPQQQTCALSLQYTSDGNQIGTNKTCGHYTRVISGPVLHEPSLKDAFSTLEIAIVTDNLTVSVTLNSSQNLELKALNITDAWKQKEPEIDKYDSKYSVFANFKRMPHSSLYRMSSSFYGDVSVVDCAYICLQELTFTCSSFQYQANISKCAVSHLFPDENKDQISMVYGIDLYSRDYTSQYIETPNHLILDSNTTSKTLQDVHSASSCAKQCNRNASFPCKSFNYSPTSQRCIMYQQLYYGPQDTHGIKTALWNFYTLDYTKQFRKFWNVEYTEPFETLKIDQPQDRRYSFETNEEMSIQECARRCVENINTWFYCDSFSETYSDSGTCKLYSTSLYDLGYYKTASALDTHIYNREYYPDGRRYIPHTHFDGLTTPSTTTSTPTTTFTSTTTTTTTTTTTPTTTTTKRRLPTTYGPTRRPTSATSAAKKTTINAITQTKVTPQPAQCSTVTATPCTCDCKGETTSSKSSNDGHTYRVHQTPTPDHKTPYPTGTVVGVAIAMLVVGVLIGVGAVYFKYSRQHQPYGKSYITNRAYSP